MKTKDIVSLDNDEIMKLTKKDIARYTTIIGSTVNKRLKRNIDILGETSPAYSNLIKSGGKITVANKTLPQLRAEFLRAQRFLRAKTSTVKGFKEWKKNVRESLTGNLTEEQTDKFFKVFNRLKEGSTFSAYEDRYKKLIYYLRDSIENDSEFDEEKMFNAAKDFLREEYEKGEMVRHAKGISSFFKM